MTTKDILNQMEKEFDEKFRDMKDSWNVDVVGYDVTKQDIKSFYLKHIRTLLESFGEEILDIQLPRVPEDISDRRYSMGLVRGFNAVQEKARLKVKEILQNIS